MASPGDCQTGVGLQYVSGMNSPSIDRHHVRRLLDEQLRADADLDAFCLDFFPDVHQRFTARMERTQKVNLLLTMQNDPQIIAKRLTTQHSQTTGGARSPQRWSRIGWALIVLAGLALAVLAVRKLAYPPPVGVPPVIPYPASPPAESTAVPPAAPAALPAAQTAAPVAGINSGNQIVNSPGAHMHNLVRLPTGRTRGSLNSGNRITGSAGAQLANEVAGTVSR